MQIRQRLLILAVSAFILSSLHAQTLASAKPPAYPLAAKAAGIDGPVILKGTVSKEGKLQNVRVVSGSPELRQAALDAVNNWTYKPYHHFGHAVEVDTTITVNFDMGAGDKKRAEQAKAQAELAKSNQTPAPQITQQAPSPKQD